MNKWQEDIERFHQEVIELDRRDTIGLITRKERKLRLKLMYEELSELAIAMHEGDLIEIADGIIDLLVVTIGTGCLYGFDLEPLWEEVQRSNMAKKGGKRRADGKQLKPKDWTPPDIKSILMSQIKT